MREVLYVGINLTKCMQGLYNASYIFFFFPEGNGEKSRVHELENSLLRCQFSPS